MVVLALDISTSAGYAVLRDGVLVCAGTIKSKKKIDEYGTYPYSYTKMAEYMAQAMYKKVLATDPDVVVIEETNKGKNRYTQKALEFMHLSILTLLAQDKYMDRVKYVNTSDWRRMVGAQLNVDEKKQNTLLSKAKTKAKKNGVALDKKELGIRGKITKKHVAIRVANAEFNLELRPKDDDIADAICMALAYTRGVAICDGH